MQQVIENTSVLYYYYFITISTVRNVPAESQTKQTLCTHPSLLKYVRLKFNNIYIDNKHLCLAFFLDAGAEVGNATIVTSVH